jgi:hypothetical protein
MGYQANKTKLRENEMKQLSRQTVFLIFSLIISCAGRESLASWNHYETTNVKGSISGSIRRGKILEMSSGSIYKVSGLSLQLVLEIMPDATVLRNGREYKLIIEGFDEPLICEQIKPPRYLASKRGAVDTQGVVESYVDGEFEGWDGDTIVQLVNGQIWEQAAYKYHYSYRYQPKVTIFKTRASWMMLVEGMEPVPVRRIK